MDFRILKKRVNIFIAINVFLLIIWIGYLFNVQILDPHNLINLVDIRQNPKKEILIPKRGNIYDCNKNLLVGTKKYLQLDFDRTSLIRNYKDSLRTKKLNKVIDIFHDNSSLNIDLLRNKILKKPLKSSIHISENFSEYQVTKIKEELKKENIKGLIVTFNKIERTYPRSKLGANFLGIIEETNQDDEQNLSESIYSVSGKCGLEKSYDEELSGKNGWRETIEDANNNRIPFLFLRQKDAINGNSLILTIDNQFQEILEERLKKGLIEYQAKNAIGIIMEPNSGKIKAMFGIAKNNLAASGKVLRSLPNMPVASMFEPGSTLKPITALLALEDGIFEPDDKIDCSDYHLTFGNKERVIKDDHDHDHEYNILSFRDIIAHSSNVGISKIVEKIGQKKLFDRLIALGFRHRIGYNISGEAAGSLRKLSDWQSYSLHSISFGQEISVTALQLANAYCVLANDGKVMQPYMVDKVINEDQKVVQQFKPKVLREISDKKSLNTLKQFMKNVVDYGTATKTKIEFLDVAGKTGTAEKNIQGKSGYSKDKYISIFAGFFPVEKPKYVIVIAYDEADYESYSYYASLSAVPTFKNVVLDIVNLPQSNIISADLEEKTEFVQAPNLIGLSKSEAIKKLNEKNIKYQLKNADNTNIVSNQFPKPNISYDKNETFLLILGNPEEKNSSDFGNNKMPNLVGLSVRKAITKAYKSYVELKIDGVGRICSQSIKPGANIQYGAKCLAKANL